MKYLLPLLVLLLFTSPYFSYSHDSVPYVRVRSTRSPFSPCPLHSTTLALWSRRGCIRRYSMYCTMLCNEQCVISDAMNSVGDYRFRILHFCVIYIVYCNFMMCNILVSILVVAHINHLLLTVSKTVYSSFFSLDTYYLTILTAIWPSHQPYLFYLYYHPTYPTCSICTTHVLPLGRSQRILLRSSSSGTGFSTRLHQ